MKTDFIDQFKKERAQSLIKEFGRVFRTKPTKYLLLNKFGLFLDETIDLLVKDMEKEKGDKDGS